MRNVYILHLLMFSRWCARWNFNGVLMATARVYGAQAVLGKEGRDKRKRRRRRKEASEKRMSTKIAVTVRTCRCHEVASAFTPRSTWSFASSGYILFESRHAIARQHFFFICMTIVHSLIGSHLSSFAILMRTEYAFNVHSNKYYVWNIYFHLYY